MESEKTNNFEEFSQEIGNEEEVKTLPPKKWYHGITLFLLFSALVAVLGSFLFGMVIGIMNSPFEAITICNTTSNEIFQPCIPMQEYQWTLVIVGFPIGALFGSLSASIASDFIGRKVTLWIAHLVTIIGTSLLSIFSSVVVFVFGRILIGLGVGACSVLVPMYLAEISPTHLRGFIGSFNPIANTVGILFAQLLGVVLSFQPGWRILLAFQALPSIIAVILLPFVGNSPTWFLLKGRKEDAEKSLKKLRNEENVDEEMSEIIENTIPNNFYKSFKSFIRKETIRPLIAGAGLHISQQISGINVVYFYSTSIFKSAGIESASLITVLTGLVTIIANFVALGLVERFGRRILLILGTLVQFVSFLVLALCFILQDYSPKVLSIISILCVLTYIFGFAFGLGPITWIMIGELFPSDSKSIAMGISVCINWLSTTIVVLTFPYVRILLGKYAFLPYVTFIFGIIFFEFFAVPETKGLKSEEIKFKY